MILNDDILDAIRNKKYALKKVEPPILGKIKKKKLMLYHFLLKKHSKINVFLILGPMKIVTIRQDGTGMLAKLIDRRVRMEYSDESDDEKSLHSQNMYSF